jgi:hypothetical protein
MRENEELRTAQSRGFVSEPLSSTEKLLYYFVNFGANATALRCSIFHESSLYVTAL